MDKYLSVCGDDGSSMCDKSQIARHTLHMLGTAKAESCKAAACPLLILAQQMHVLQRCRCLHACTSLFLIPAHLTLLQLTANVTLSGPSASHTSHWISCEDAICKRQPSMIFCDSSEDLTTSSSSSGQCVYEISYAEQSASKGRLVRDVFRFPDNVTTVPVTLGCESGETGEIFNQKADGILGMGNHQGTFHAEVSEAAGEWQREAVTL